MTSEQIEDLTKEVTFTLSNANAISDDNAFLRRILKQAILTHGGELKIDINLADAAKNDKRQFVFGSGKVVLE